MEKVVLEYLKDFSTMLWDNCMIWLLMGVGIYFTFATKFVQLRYFKNAFLRMADNFSRREKEQEQAEGSISSFQALTNAIASCVGTGNIVGVSTAIAGGGPGAVFWMWVMGIVGMATKYAEIVLGIVYRQRNKKGEMVGGPMYYMEKGMGSKALATLFAWLMFFQICGGGLIQSNTVSELLQNTFGVKNYLSGFVLAAGVYCVAMGGLQRLGKVTEKLVPFMALLYIVGSLLVLAAYRHQLAGSLKMVVQEAFSFTSLQGGLFGHGMKQAMRYGAARGLYSNEAGEGSAPVLHSSAKVKNPHEQGIMGILEVFFDTLVICTMTALVVISSGIYQQKTIPGVFVLKSFESVNYMLRYIVFITLVLFAFSTMISQWYFGNQALSYVFSDHVGDFFQYIFLVIILLGAMSSNQIVWTLQDIILGFMVFPNLIALMVLRKDVLHILKQEDEHVHRRKI